ncbi:hypothetical protein Vretimale_15111 [Volvox reticuliferus]|uniref:Uncharacterized protein n=1 Tax=Volvox reticuliferus TaxID=1737510 RepID=A0A8J4GR58_9CHLO|nr:hypothetical protein Vretimale_15111 [Volvox reticuliferus]
MRHPNPPQPYRSRAGSWAPARVGAGSCMISRLGSCVPGLDVHGQHMVVDASWVAARLGAGSCAGGRLVSCDWGLQSSARGWLLPQVRLGADSCMRRRLVKDACRAGVADS